MLLYTVININQMNICPLEKQILKHLEVTEKQMVKHNLNNIFIYYINIL